MPRFLKEVEFRADIFYGNTRITLRAIKSQLHGKRKEVRLLQTKKIEETSKVHD